MMKVFRLKSALKCFAASTSRYFLGRLVGNAHPHTVIDAMSPLVRGISRSSSNDVPSIVEAVE